MASKIKDTTPERLASIEARFDAFMVAVDERHRENQAQFKALSEAQQTLKAALDRYTGFWGAILLIGGILATVWGILGGLLRKKLGWE